MEKVYHRYIPEATMLLKNVDTVFRQDAERRIEHGVDILLRDGRIVEVGEGLSGGPVWDCRNKIALPGLVNCHAHTPNLAARGWSDDLPLFAWLDANDRLLRDAERSDKRPAARLSAARMVETGTTTVNDMWNTYLVGEFEAVGIRALVGKGMAAFEDTATEEIDEALAHNREFAVEHAEHPTIHPTVPVHSVYRATADLLERAHALATDRDLPFHIHLSETEAENEDCLAERGATPTGWLDGLGALDERAVLAHCVHLSDADRRRIAESGAGVAHCASANLKLGSGIADIPALEGVPVGLGTDGAASNNSLNLVREARTATLVHKREDPGAVTAQRALDAVTCEAAAALGMADEIGSIEVGKRGDIVLLDKSDPTLTPHLGDEGLLSNLIYSFRGRVETTIVNGEVVVEDGNTEADVDGAAAAVQAFCDSVIRTDGSA